MDISKHSIEAFLRKREGKSVKVTEFVELGSGWHGTGYSISFKVGKKTKKAVLRTIRPVGFSHDHASDRAAVFLLQNDMFNSIPSHVRSVDVGGFGTKGELVSIGGVKEFFQIVEVADGVPYMEDLERISRDRKLREADINNVLNLSDYLVSLHKKKFRGGVEEQRSLRLRHLRDVVGHGEMLMGVIDTYPDKLRWIGKSELASLICDAVKFSYDIRDIKVPLSKIHGDFHPGNIWFRRGGGFTLLDASREPYGFPADDITALTVNYIAYALRSSGKFDGAMKDLFLAFWDNYLSKSKDRYLATTLAPFLAFRLVVVAHPLFYPKQSDEVRRKFFKLASSVLREKKFDPRKIDRYLGA